MSCNVVMCNVVICNVVMCNNVMCNVMSCHVISCTSPTHPPHNSPIYTYTSQNTPQNTTQPTHSSTLTLPNPILYYILTLYTLTQSHPPKQQPLPQPVNADRHVHQAPTSSTQHGPPSSHPYAQVGTGSIERPSDESGRRQSYETHYDFQSASRFKRDTPRHGHWFAVPAQRQNHSTGQSAFPTRVEAEAAALLYRSRGARVSEP